MWLKKHIDTFIVIGVLSSIMFYFHSNVSGNFKNIDARFNKIEKDLAIIKTVLVMKGILPKELTLNDIKEE